MRMKKVSVFSKKLDSVVNIELGESKQESITCLYDQEEVKDRNFSLETEFSKRNWEAWVNAGWNNWGAICN
jgi:hypothetical protein